MACWGGGDNMIRAYLNQAAIWKQVVSVDGYPPQPEEKGTEIKVRWESKRRMVRNTHGQEMVSEARAWCLEDVKPGDVLNFGGRDWPVLAVAETPELDGKMVVREVAV